MNDVAVWSLFVLAVTQSIWLVTLMLWRRTDTARRDAEVQLFKNRVANEIDMTAVLRQKRLLP